MSDDSAVLLGRYRDGDEEAARALFERYTERLRALLHERIAAQLARRIEADDVIQSAYRSFFVHARAGDFVLAKTGDLWRLLASITLHKLRRQARWHRAAKRAVQREETLPSDEREFSAWCVSREPEPGALAAAEDEFAWLGAQLEPRQRRAVGLRLQEHKFEEIAAALGCSEKTVRRWLADIQALLAERLREQRDDIAPVAAAHHAPNAVVHEPPVARLDYADYQLRRFIGAGGMSKVYEATERSSQLTVAFKVLRKPLRRRKHFQERFLQEAAIVARLQHPHIVPLRGLGRLPDGGYFMVLNYVAGTSAAALCQGRSLPPRQAAAMVAVVAAAIEAAHAGGVIHCDLKPANVLVSAEGAVFVTDFGFAWVTESAAREGTVMGTAGFMAPEQLDPHRGPLGPHTDVFGLGALLWALIAGAAPHLSDMGQSGAWHAGGGAEFPGDQAQGFPGELVSICRRCMAAEPGQRYHTAHEVAAALRDWINSADGSPAGGI